LIQRVAALIGILFVISVGCFYLVHLIPGNPAITILGPAAANPSSIAKIDAELGLNKPIYAQYFVWLGHVFQGNMGKGSVSREPVTSLIARSFKLDIELILLSQIMAFLIAIPLAVYSARRSGGLLDQVSTSSTFALFCLPGFIIVVWAVKYLTVDWHVFPGVDSDPFSGGGAFLGSAWLGGVWHNIDVLLLPSMVLALGSIAIYFRLLRSEMVFTLQEEFITAARSKGLTTNRILWRHAVRPSSITTLTSAGNNIALLITGLFIVEIKFQLPGLGYDLINAIYQNDYLTIQGIALVAAVTVVIANFAIDLVTPLIDPRIARA